MITKSLYRVKFTYDVVVVAEDALRARDTFRQELNEGSTPIDTADEQAELIKTLDDTPDDWSPDAIPYGGSDERSIREWLRRDKPLIVRGDPARIETLLASMRDVAARMGVEILDAPDVPDAAPMATDTVARGAG